MTHTCANCGATVECDAPRHNRIGDGYWKAKEATKLSVTEQFCIYVLTMKHASDWKGGMTSRDVWKGTYELYQVNGMRQVTMNTIRRALSYLQGHGFANCGVNEVEVKDQETLEYKWGRQERWWVPNQVRGAYERFPKKDWPHPIETQEVLA